MLPGLMIFVPNPDRMRQSQPDGFGKGSIGFDVEWDLMSFEAKNVLEVLNGHFSGVFELISEQSEGFLLASSVRLASSGGTNVFLFLRLPRSPDEERLTAGNGEGSAVANNPVRIWEDQWMHHRPAVISRMAARLGRCTRIHGRETVVQRVDSNTGLQFLEANHLLVPLKGKYRFGLYYQEELRSLAVFSGARQMKSQGANHRSFDLLRFCHAGMQLVSGGLGKLLSAFAAAFQPDDIMTYLDMEWPGGEAFLKNGFTPAGTLPPQIFWINPDDGIRYYPGRLPAALQGAGPEGLHELG